jgi:nucleotide-binding universal stress UspA family protein
MAQEVFVVAYDGTDLHPVDFAISRAAREGARLLIVHVLEWSPYSFLTTEELAERHKLRQQELARADQSIMTPILKRARGAGATADGELRYGNIVDCLCSIAKEKDASMIFVGRSSSLSTRLFGSVASGLAQCASVPTVIVPCE